MGSWLQADDLSSVLANNMVQGDGLPVITPRVHLGSHTHNVKRSLHMCLH